MNLSIPLVKAEKAITVCKEANLRASAQKLLDDVQAPHHYLQKLVSNNLLADAIRFLAHGLPKRHALWWGCICLRLTAAGRSLAPVEEKALLSAVQWTVKPTDDHRRAAGVDGNAATTDTVAGLLASGAFWSGGSMNAADGPVLPPAPHLTGIAVAEAIISASALDGDAAEEKYEKEFLTLGIEIAQHKRGWDRPI